MAYLLASFRHDPGMLLPLGLTRRRFQKRRLVALHMFCSSRPSKVVNGKTVKRPLFQGVL